MDGKSLFRGNLNFLGLADVFQILGGNNATGILCITSPYVEAPASVDFLNGNPVNATLGPLKGLDAVYAMFGWSDGYFEFRPGKTAKKSAAIKSSRMQIVLDALRMIDDGRIKKVGPPSFVDDEDSGNLQGEGTAKADLFPAIQGPPVDYLYVVKDETVPKGEKIVTEGSYGNWVWVILDGRVRITRNTPKGPLVLAQLAEGSFIGTFTAFQFQDFIRTATATAVGRVHLGLLDTQRLAGEFASLSKDFRRILIELTDRLKTVSDSTVRYFLEGNKKGSSDGSGGSLPGWMPVSSGNRHSPLDQQSKRSLMPIPLKKEDVLRYSLFSIADTPEHPLPRRWKTHTEEDERTKWELLKREYDNLSPTLKNMLDHLATCIVATTRLFLFYESKKGEPWIDLTPRS
ncbi:MAG: DUF4388 domain-containing protein [Deltaproteobacteria bacterium]|nr:DUF4388 domain-containing protein [Deltaproteobacteria bacterium]MBW2017112.1 DUF4388 domain-containing protein [Deltaproteobacteria bacterium]MBW2129876.1 DUF4388 domain-containing protein [Deltaproteobacteria bacterium]MBW2303113.1 DUF4388 domain-containing protein [Deltaproteobacteria bacterium]